MSRERVEQGKSLKDPGVVGAGVNTSCVGCPADATDRPGKLELAVASGPPYGRTAARAVDRDDCRPIHQGNVNDLLARQVALERQNPPIINDRDVEALSLSSHINADPRSHASKHAPLQYRPALRPGALDLTGPRRPRRGNPPLPSATAASHPRSRCQQRTTVVQRCIRPGQRPEGAFRTWQDQQRADLAGCEIRPRTRRRTTPCGQRTGLPKGRHGHDHR